MWFATLTSIVHRAVVFSSYRFGCTVGAASYCQALRRTAKTTGSWLAVWRTTAKARDCDVRRAKSWCKVATPCANPPFWYFSGVTRSALAQDTSVARTIRFPASLRERITSDAERCGRSFEGQVLALLRRHYGEDVDIAPSPNDILALATASLADVPVADARALVRRLKEAER